MWYAAERYAEELGGILVAGGRIAGGGTLRVDRQDWSTLMYTILLLVISKAFMQFEWYGHLKHRSLPIMYAIVVSWLIAFGEYCFQVPANRIGYEHFTGYQLKIVQECITLVVFAVFAYFYLGEPVRWNYVASFLCILGAVGFAFVGKL